MITVVNIHDEQIFPYVYIGRRTYHMPASPLGNPFKLKEPLYVDTIDAERARVINLYREWLWKQMKTDSETRRELYRLAEIAREGHLNLGCWCAPQSCHGDVVKAAIEWILKEGR